MTHTAVVTDSTATLPPAVAGAAGEARTLQVVPLDVVVDGVATPEGSGLPAGEVAAALRRRAQVTTSRPSSAALLSAYRAAAETGADGIVSIHLSGGLSGTVDAAEVAARESPVPVRVIDSGSIGAGLGFAVATAVAAAERGLELGEVADLAAHRAQQTSVIFSVDTLEYLRRGGRIGAGQAIVGTALAVKPILAIERGEIVSVDKVRTANRALHRLEEIVVERASGLLCDLAIHHLDNDRRAQAMADRLTRRLALPGRVPVAELGAVLGAHAGPGVLGVVISPR